MKKEKIGHQCHGSCNRKAEHSQPKPASEYPSTGNNLCPRCGGRFDEGGHCCCGNGDDCCSRQPKKTN